MSEIQLPTVLCVETEESEFVSTREISGSGAFRVISATNASAALSALATSSVDAVVLDTRALRRGEASIANRLRQVAPAIPHLLVCPSTEIKELSDPAGLTFIVHRETLLLRLHNVIKQTQAASAQLRKSAEQSRELRNEQRELRGQLRSQVNKLREMIRRHKRPSE